MDKCKDISYCFGRPNTLWEVQCVICERYLELYDFCGQVYTVGVKIRNVNILWKENDIID